MRRRTAGEESGIVLLVFAIMLTVLVIVTATVVDLGGLRADAREDQTIADFAVTAGALELDPTAGGTPERACNAAWGYFLANSHGVPANAPGPCGVFAGVPLCQPSAVTPSRTAVGIIDDYRLEITYPVTDASPLLEGRLVGEIDGDACSRIGVSIRQGRDLLWGGVIGAQRGSTGQSAVARAGSAGGTMNAPVSLLLLDPTGCNALQAKGQSQIRVAASGGLPGIIAVDSAATEQNAPPGQSERNCGSNAYAIDAVGTQNSAISAGDGAGPGGTPVPGAIYSYALMPGQGNAKAYEEADVTGGRLTPRPRANERITRSPFDWRYNCKAANGCPEAGPGTTPEIDDLRAYVGTSGKPPGFREFPRDVIGGQCAMQPSTPAALFVGDWWINCNRFSVANPVTFTGGNVIFQGDVSVGASGSILANVGGTTERWMYFRNGSFDKDAQAAINLHRTFVYMDNGRISFGAGSGLTRWIAPEAGPFEDLTLWSESTVMHQLGGQAGLELEGTFFTPNANPFRYAGQGGQNQANAQFVSWRLESTGQGTLLMRVNPDRSTPLPLTGIQLIR